MMNDFLVMFIKMINLLSYLFALFIGLLMYLPMDGGFLLYLLYCIGCTCGCGFLHLVLSCIDKFLNE